jgi:hypothetical protein
MSFYELPGLSLNSDFIVAVEKKNEDVYVLQLSGVGGYYLTAEQTEVFKKLVEKDTNSKSLSVKAKKGETEEYGEGADHPPINETFVPPIAPDHPLNDANFGRPPANQSLDMSISLPQITGKVIDASEDRNPATTIDANANAEKPAKESKADSKDKDKDDKK